MLILFGMRVATTLLATVTYVCERCGQNGAHRITRDRRQFTLFFVPVFPVGSARFTDTCLVCGRMLDISEAQAASAAVPMSPGPQDAAVWPPQDR